MLTTLLQVATLLAIVGLFLFGRRFLPTYVAEKGKNLATKEDVGAITKEIERARLEYLTELERTKTLLQSETSALDKRRHVYEAMVQGVSVFIAGRATTREDQERFLAAYQSLWLWAPDEVIKAVNTFLDFNVRFTAQPGSISELDYKNSFVDILITMRRDIGFASTMLGADGYRFVSFGASPAQRPIDANSPHLR